MCPFNPMLMLLVNQGVIHHVIFELLMQRGIACFSQFIPDNKFEGSGNFVDFLQPEVGNGLKDIGKPGYKWCYCIKCN